MKKSRIIFYILLLSPKTVFGQGVVPLTPGLPNPLTWTAVVNWIIPTILTIGTALAVLMFVIGGVQILLYGGSQSAQSAAKEKMWNAFIGLGILWLSYTALELIDPNLVSFSF